MIVIVACCLLFVVCCLLFDGDRSDGDYLSRTFTPDQLHQLRKFGLVMEQCIRLEASNILDEFIFVNPIIRDKSADILVKLLKNLNIHLQNPTNGSSKACIIKESNSIIRYSIIRVVGAVDILSFVGYELQMSEQGYDREYICRRALDCNSVDAMRHIKRNRFDC